MLQQTQVSRVREKYAEFLDAFPTVYELANAENGSVLRVWQGLGYNSRGLRLKQLAQTIVNEYDGVFPTKREELEALPGIGSYTAGAIMTFAYEKTVAFYDTNIERILERYESGILEKPLTAKGKQELAETYLCEEDSYHYHQALMDLGSTLCLSKRLTCHSCPLAGTCKAASQLKANPELADTIKRRKKSVQKKPFRETDRFLRGRIVDHLREKHEGATEQELFQILEHLAPKKEEARWSKVIEKLLEEGLIQKQGGKLLL